MLTRANELTQVKRMAFPSATCVIAMSRAEHAGEMTMADVGETDFAVIVYREEDTWEAELLPVALTEDLNGLIHALKQQPSVGGTIGLAAVGDDFFVALRVLGTQVSVFLSDVTAAVDWTLARQVLEYLGIPLPGRRGTRPGAPGRRLVDLRRPRRR